MLYGPKFVVHLVLKAQLDTHRRATCHDSDSDSLREPGTSTSSLPLLKYHRRAAR